ncbi:hypothetical protein JOM56_011179 [Amanita muscaria]|uniref:Uncharacterized protein n=1 Tax=Amanita muscaria (strain Koide BX008) TaxID=946122 RepID=A0A0C2TC03_AMAMK|nr:hypothetical protein M378DRAFT_163365 [Amanita muscaria Koide BX008]
MESLNSLASSLPTAHQNAEKELLNNFKAAALSITTLYRSSRETAKGAYDAGYAAACQDLLNMIQQGVSASGIDDSEDSEGMSIGRIMDWTEARLQALKQKEEEEEEEEEKEKEKERERGKPATATTAPAPSATKVTKSSSNAHSSRTKDTKSSMSPVSSPLQRTVDPPSISSSVPMRPAQRVIKPRPSAKGDGSSPYVGLPSAHSFDFFAEPRQAMMSSPSSNFTDISAGAKRRHAMMMMLDAASTPVSIDGSSGPPSPAIHHVSNHLASSNGMQLAPGLGRRRTRSSRISSQHQMQNQAINLDAMDVEEENGRERKRVARR